MTDSLFFDWATFVIASGGLLLGVFNLLKSICDDKTKLVLKSEIVFKRLIFGDESNIAQPELEVINHGKNEVTVTEIGYFIKNDVLIPLSNDIFYTTIDREIKYLPIKITPGFSVTFNTNASLLTMGIKNVSGFYIKTATDKAFRGKIDNKKVHVTAQKNNFQASV